MSIYCPLPLPHLMSPLNSFLFSMDFSLVQFKLNVIMQFVTFYVWLLSLKAFTDLLCKQKQNQARSAQVQNTACAHTKMFSQGICRSMTFS